MARTNWKDTPVTRHLGIDLPIVQGPFGGGLSSVDLLTVVSEAGGLGSFGVHHLDAEGIARTAREIRARTERSFALNLWIPLEPRDDPTKDSDAFAAAIDVMRPYFKELGVPVPGKPERFGPRYEDQVEALIEARPAVFSFVYGIPSSDVIDRCHQQAITTLGAATTPDEAIALEAAGVDMIVATGFEAGGHRVSFLRSPEASLMGSFALIPQVVDSVKIPVIAAGGIADARGISAAMTLGAAAVQIGTAFLACEESNAGTLHRRMLFSADARYTGLTRAFSGRLARGIRNRFMEEMHPYQGVLPPYPDQNWLTSFLKRAAIERDRPDLMSLWSGQAAPLLKKRAATELLASLVEGVENLS